jgi:diguanylate cyclase (GGDEF)-like protein/PAS domain S-box-containing protein
MKTDAKPDGSPWRSLKVRITAVTLVIFMLGIWALSLFVSRSLQADMEQMLGEQQFSVVTSIAKNVNDDLTDRVQALETVAKEMDAALLAHPAALQTLLEQRPLLQLLFNGGVFVTGADGIAIADVPLSAGRIGTNYMDRDNVSISLKEGKTVIGQPVIGRKLGTPVFSMVAPIRDVQGQVIGALVAAVNLGRPNFLDKITQSQYGKTGGYFLISPRHKLFVTATDKSRIMQPVPEPGLNAMHDRYMQGYTGFGLAVSSRGVLELSAAKDIPAMGWFVVAILPAAEAFAPVRDMQKRLLWATLLLTVLTGALTWLVLRRQLAPLVATAYAMTKLANSKEMPQPLPEIQPGEIGQLVAGFNRILKTWAQREAALTDSQQNLAITLHSIGDAVIATDTYGRITRMNPAAERLTGWPLAEARGKSLSEVFRIIDAQTRLSSVNPVQLVMAHGEVVGLANHTALLARDGREYQIADSAAPIQDAAGQIVGVVLVFSDVTERYRSEVALQNSEQQYRLLLENLSSGVVVHNPDTSIQISNAMAATLLGLTQDQMQGKTAPDPQWCFLRDDATLMPLAEYPVNRVLASGEHLRNYVVGVHHPERADPTWVLCSAYPMRDDLGNIFQVVVTFTDITTRKKAEAALVASEKRWKFAIEGAGDGLWDWNVQTGKAYYSPRYKSMLGFAEDEIGDSADEWSKRIHLDDAAGVLAALQPYIDGKVGAAEIEFRIQCKDGRWMWIQGRGMVVQRDEDGKPLRMIGTNRDISERRAAQEKLQLAASVFGCAREGIIIADVKGSIIDVNEAFTRITGYSREEVLGQNPRMLQSGRQDQAFYATMWTALTVQGHWSGEIWNRHKTGEVFAELLTVSAVRDAQGQTLRYVALFSDITAIKSHQSQLEHIAHFDALTNLPNRVLLADRLQQAMAQGQRRGKKVAVVYLDLDGFKAINDRHGHQAGDQILVTLAQRMKEVLREGDTMARMGGDEFVAVLIDLPDTQASVPLLERLLAAAAEPVQMGELSLQVSASLGVTFCPQIHDFDADQLLRQADQAMYQAKLAGKNRYHVFDAAQDSNLRSRHESLERIRLALENHEFVLHYQPKVNMHTGQVIGAEALIRWQHPEKGLLAPMTFLPVIEDHPLAVDVGEWVIDTAMHQMALWHVVGLDLPVSVNIGARQLQQANFVERLQAIFARHPQVQPGCIELEVLETSALADMAQVSQVIEDCAQIGVKFALDDFGTGYSSLTYLKRLRVALLKIDQSFVRDMLDDPDDLAILQGIVGLAAAFKREVIAEGVETVAHGNALLQLGCELAQGYGIARPMPPDKMPAWVARWQPDEAWTALPWLGGDEQVAEG